MIKYILYKFFMMIVTLWLIITSVFFIMKALPGGPFDLEKEIPESVKYELEKKYGLDKPLAVQYVKYIKNIAVLDFGESYKDTGQKVTYIIKKAFKYSALIGFSSIFIAIFSGLFLGVFLAESDNEIKINNKEYKFKVIFNKFLNKIISAGSTFGIATPNFVLAVLFVYLFCEYWPVMAVGDLDSFKSYIGPILILSVYPASFIMKIVKVNMKKILEENYISVLKAYGINKKKILFKYSLKEVLIPVITYAAPMLASVVMGSFAVEKIFVIPGLGRIFIDSVFMRDYYVVFGLILFYSVVYLIAIFVTDICYFIIDPRLKLSFALKKESKL